MLAMKYNSCCELRLSQRMLFSGVISVHRDVRGFSVRFCDLECYVPLSQFSFREKTFSVFIGEKRHEDKTEGANAAEAHRIYLIFVTVLLDCNEYNSGL